MVRLSDFFPSGLPEGVLIGFTASKPVIRTNLRLMTVAGAMLEFDSYREVLIEHARDRHLVKTAWFMVIALAVFIIAPA